MRPWFLFLGFVQVDGVHGGGGIHQDILAAFYGGLEFLKLGTDFVGYIPELSGGIVNLGCCLGKGSGSLAEDLIRSLLGVAFSALCPAVGLQLRICQRIGSFGFCFLQLSGESGQFLMKLGTLGILDGKSGFQLSDPRAEIFLFRNLTQGLQFLAQSLVFFLQLIRCGIVLVAETLLID